jgi:membrane protein
VGLYAAHAGYFIVLSLFPTLVLVLGLLRNTGLEAERLLSVVEGFVPQVLIPAVRRLIGNAYQNTSGVVLPLSAVAALWSAGRGIYGLITGLNAIYDVQESRGYFYTRTVSMGYMFAFLGILLLTLLLDVFGGHTRQAFAGNSRFLRFLDDVIGLRLLLLLLLQTGLFTAMYMALPNVTVPLRCALPGGVLASVGWLGFSRLYSYYVTHFTGYAGIYGSVYSVAVSLLWLYFCISILFYGGVVNCWLKKRYNIS